MIVYLAGAGAKDAHKPALLRAGFPDVLMSFVERERVANFLADEPYEGISSWSSPSSTTSPKHNGN